MIRRFYLSFAILSIFGNALMDRLAAPDVETRLRDMFNAMNRSIDPCENFYDYMCGNWQANNPIPAEQESWSELEKLRHRTKERIRAMLEEKIQPCDTEQTKLAKTYFRSCMNEEAIEARGLQPIKEILESNGGWPILTDDWESRSTKYTWQTVHANYQKLYNIGAFFKVSLNADSVNSSKIVIMINRNVDYPLLNSMSKEQESDFFFAYMMAINDIIADFVEDSGKTVTEEVLNEISDLIVFQSLLQRAKQNRDTGNSSGKTYETMTIKELQKYYDNKLPSRPVSQINFLEQIRTIFSDVSEEINEETTVEVHKKVELLTLKWFLRSASPRMAVNYVHWNLVANLLPYTNRKMRGYLQRLRSVLSKSIQEIPRWETCLDEMQLEQALSYDFAKKYADEATIGKVTDMAYRIRHEIHNRILQSGNLNEEGRAYVTRKLNGVKFIIGYPRWYANESAVADYYNGLTVGPDYFQNRLNYYEYERMKYGRTFEHPFDKYNWFKSSATVNAFYYAQANTIVIPLAKFLDALPDASVPEFVAYARIGSALGHEMTHSITGETDLMYDEYGNMLSTPVNTSSAEGEWNSVCFETQFGSYVLGEVDGEIVHLNGALTANENMADTLGIQVSQNAYVTAKGEINAPAAQIPQELASFTEEQLFFMVYASQYCQVIRPELEHLTQNTDAHSPPNYRVIGTLANSYAFSRAFNCSASSRMGSPDKCQTL